MIKITIRYKTLLRIGNAPVMDSKSANKWKIFGVGFCLFEFDFFSLLLILFLYFKKKEKTWSLYPRLRQTRRNTSGGRGSRNREYRRSHRSKHHKTIRTRQWNWLTAQRLWLVVTPGAAQRLWLADTVAAQSLRLENERSIHTPQKFHRNLRVQNNRSQRINRVGWNQGTEWSVHVAHRTATRRESRRGAR